jgi:hypothetical protein
LLLKAVEAERYSCCWSTGYYRLPGARFSHVQRKIGAGQGAYRLVDTCLDE